MSEETTPKRKITISQDKMTLGDLEDFEELTGKSFSEAMRRVKVIDPETGEQAKDPDPEAKGKGLWAYEMSMKGLRALVYLSLRKEDPSVTFESLRDMRLDELDMEVAEDPTSADSPDESENSA